MRRLVHRFRRSRSTATASSATGGVNQDRTNSATDASTLDQTVNSVTNRLNWDRAAAARLDDSGISLHDAASKGLLLVIHKRLSEGAAIDAVDSKGSTPLLLAIKQGQLGAVELLLNLGADVEALGSLSTLRPVHAAAMTLNPTVMAKLLKYGPDLESRANGLTALFFAILAGDDQVVQLLLEAGADATAKTFCEPGTGESVLHMAAASWRDSMVPLLIEYGADVNASGTNPAGQTALHIAAENGNEDALRELIRAGADVFATYADGKTALHAAAKGGNINTAEILIDHGIDILARYGRGTTPMCVAAMHNRRKMVQFFLDRCGSFMSEESKVDVVIRAAGTGHVGILEMLNSAGFPILGRDGIGDTGLSAASYFGHKDAVVFLLRRGADPRQQSNSGTTARYLANLAGHGDVAELLQGAERLLAVDANAELFPGWKKADVVDASCEAEFWAGAMSVSETRKVHAPREFSGTFICIHCKYLDFRRGMPPDAEVVHFVSMASLTHSASRGCNGCQFLCDCLAKITDVHGQGIWGDQPAINLTLHSMALGKPLLLSSGRPTSRLSRRVEIYVKEGTRPTWPTVGIGRDTLFSNWSEERAAIARQYLRECIVNHKHCPYSTGLLPKRVIRVGSAGQDPHLYISTGELADYVTLSHSWGGVSPITTTTNTISQRMKTIPYKSLPKTFQDAVTITRSLGIQYLWIDSLCIVQDSQEDWQREAANMKHVYANCYAMISADDSPNPHGGCFNSTAGAGPTSYAVDSEGPLFSKVRAYVRLIHLRDPFHMEVCHRIGDLNAPPETSRSLLNLRGWTLQERVLAPRVLHFGRSEFAWECPETLACECQPTPTNFDKESRFKALLADSALRVGQPDKHNSITHDEVDILLWTHFVSEFTQRQLTYSTDTLHALSGLASYMAAAAKADYICGIWKQKLSEFLMWRVDYALGVKTELSSAPFRVPLFNHARPPVYPRRHKSYYAPSWSWASIIGPITFLAGRLDTSDKDQVSHIRKDGTIERTTGRRVSLLETPEIEYVTAPSNPFGPPRHASLTVSCQTAPVVWASKNMSTISEMTRSKNGGTLVYTPSSTSSTSTSLNADFEPDIPDQDLDVSLGDSLLLMYVILTHDATVEKRETTESGGTVVSGQKGTKLEGLALTPTSASSDGRAVYRRVGIFEAEGTEWQRIATRQNLTVI